MCRVAEGRLSAVGGRRVRLGVVELCGGGFPRVLPPPGALLVECSVEAPEAEKAAVAAHPEAEGVSRGGEGGAQRLTIEVPASYPVSPARALFSSSRPEYDTPLGVSTRTWFMTEIEFSKRWGPAHLAYPDVSSCLRSLRIPRISDIVQPLMPSCSGSTVEDLAHLWVEAVQFIASQMDRAGLKAVAV